MSGYRLSVDPLSGVENYATWSIQMGDILNDLGLDGHIADGASGTDATWKTSDRKALTQIRLRVEPHIIVDIRNAKTALEAWTTLKDNYQSDGGIGIILAIRKLFSTRAQGDESTMERHLRDMKNCAEDLRTFGYPLDNKVFSLALLTSMPETWDSWVSSTALDETLLSSPSKVNAAIMMEAKRRLSGSGNDIVHDTAMVSKSRPPPRKPRNAPQSSFQSSSNPAPPKNVCYTCGGKGHMARDCPSEPDTVAAFGLAESDEEEWSSDPEADSDFAF